MVTRDRPGPEQITGPEVAAIARMMREHLGERPVKVPRHPSADPKRIDPPSSHLGRLDVRVDRDVHTGLGRTGFVGEVRERSRIA